MHEETPEEWHKEMTSDGNWCDDVFLQVAANVLDVNFILIPLNPFSAHHIGKYIDIRSIHGGQQHEPLCMLYYEEWHYQSIEPNPTSEPNEVIAHYKSRH